MSAHSCTITQDTYLRATEYRTFDNIPRPSFQAMMAKFPARKMIRAFRIARGVELIVNILFLDSNGASARTSVTVAG